MASPKNSYDPAAELAGLLDHVAAYNVRPWKLNAGAAALLVIDMQNAFLHPRGAIYLPAAAAVVPRVAALAAAFRAAGRPVLYTRHAEDAGGANAGLMAKWWDGSSPAEGTWDAEVFEELAPRPGDAVIPKIRYNAFMATDLEPRLRQAGIEDLVVAGVMANLCCESTAREAFMRDYRVFFPADGTAAPNLEFHRATLLNLAYGFAVITSCAELAAALEK